MFRQLMGCMFCAAVFFLLLTKSRTASAAIIIVIGLIWATRQRFGVNLILAGSGLLAIMALTFVMSVSGSGDSVGDAANMGRADSAGAFNGRLPIWTICIGRMGSKISVGMGYDGFWTPERIEDVSWEVGWSISSVHSEYIELILGLGIIGLALYLCAQGSAILWFWIRYYRLGTGGDAMLLGMLLTGAVQGFMETGYLHPNSLMPFLTLTGMARLAFFTDRQSAWQRAI
jgi:exopolysaccharide production protein ExoQ